MTSKIYARTIAALAAAQRLLGIDSLTVDITQPIWVIPQKKIMARIRITEEAMADVKAGAFGEAMKQQIKDLAFDATTRSWEK